ncbi:MAG: hypothetical protein IJV60_06925 [Prevotella sp.]|jgi:hypothetical protein|nr:hypothetical protein [Prevotella sp.]MBQ8059076.1 hypothetical protein [Prevotella sp.]MBQ8115720.1 hypothetical protein [Prevotella sp.]
MKKVFMFMLLAAMTLVASAQNTGLKTFDCKLFSCQYPADFEPQEQWMDNAFNAQIEDTPNFFSASVSEEEIEYTNEQLKEYGEGMRMMTEKSFGEPTGWKAGPLVIKGKSYYFIAEGEEDEVPAVKISYLVNTPNKRAFAGELKFAKKDEAKYKPLFDKIIASFKAK